MRAVMVIAYCLVACCLGWQIRHEQRHSVELRAQEERLQERVHRTEILEAQLAGFPPLQGREVSEGYAVLISALGPGISVERSKDVVEQLPGVEAVVVTLRAGGIEHRSRLLSLLAVVDRLRRVIPIRVRALVQEKDRLELTVEVPGVREGDRP